MSVSRCDQRSGVHDHEKARLKGILMSQCLEPRTSVIKLNTRLKANTWTESNSGRAHAKNKQVRVNGHRDCAGRELPAAPHQIKVQTRGRCAHRVYGLSRVSDHSTHCWAETHCTATRTHWLSKSVNSFTFNMYERFLDI